ncbi:hypothetical protein ACT0MM_004552 [Escherichia coli]|uniref:hypothetical protein n=1 Tax=Escherichia coli TaxID=562 RepID=UPI002803D3F5|nr:hypothetical protein [Escherichia coli]
MHQGGVNSLALALTAAFCGANQHNHGLLVSWALQGGGMALCILVCTSAAAPRFGAMWLLCCPGIFVRPFHPLTRIKNVITITYRVKKRENTCKYDLKVVLLFHRKGNGPLTIAQQGRRFKMKCSSVFTSTTNHVFTFERVTLCTIILIHKDTGQQYVVIFTDNNKIRDYKTGIVPQFGELKQSDVDLVLFYRDEYEKYFDSLKDGDECLSFKDFIECLR